MLAVLLFIIINKNKETEKINICGYFLIRGLNSFKSLCKNLISQQKVFHKKSRLNSNWKKAKISLTQSLVKIADGKNKNIWAPINSLTYN